MIYGMPPHAPLSEVKVYDFPEGFLWGASTSSHQVEGDNYWNDWWESELAGRLPYKSGAACRHYQRFEQDFDLARTFGHNAHRLSIEWSRIEPSQGQWNAEAFSHYRQVIRALRRRSLEPVVTLHHFTNPTWFSRSGGWTRPDSARLFARYVEHVVEYLGSEVKYWLTINEPTDYTMQGYIDGQWPPFLKAAWIKAIAVFRNLARAHVAAYKVVKRSPSDAKVGFAHNALLAVPCNPESRSDRAAATVRDWVWNRTFLHLVGFRNLDFIGLNYYKRTIVRSSGWGLGALLGRACRLAHHQFDGPTSQTGWEVYAPGLQAVLEKFSQYGLPLVVTENGIATDDESLRRDFIVSHLESLADAIERGANVIGYFYWSLIDNFEWALGTQPRFGLAAVDYETQQRFPRPGVEDFRRVCIHNQLVVPATRERI